VKSILTLVKKEFLIDFRQKYPIAGIVLYIFATIYIGYLSFQGLITPANWNALLWIILLFSFVTGISKSFISEEKRALYYFLTVPSYQILLGKLIYYTLYGFCLLALIWFVYSIFMPFPVENVSKWLYGLSLLLGTVGLTSAFTLISAIAAKTSNAATLMVVLGFPIIIPILILAVVISRRILQGAEFASIQGSITYLISIIVIIIAVSFILFPYSSRN
jgi:heme exporter protein B